MKFGSIKEFLSCLSSFTLWDVNETRNCSPFHLSGLGQTHQVTLALALFSHAQYVIFD